MRPRGWPPWSEEASPLVRRLGKKRERPAPGAVGGCQDWPDCLSCPFPRCREEVAPATFQAWARRERAGKGERREMAERRVRVRVEESGKGGKHLRGTGFRVRLPYERAVELLGQSFGIYRKAGPGKEVRPQKDGEKAPPQG